MLVLLALLPALAAAKDMLIVAWYPYIEAAGTPLSVQTRFAAAGSMSNELLNNKILQLEENKSLLFTCAARPVMRVTRL